MQAGSHPKANPGPGQTPPTCMTLPAALVARPVTVDAAWSKKRPKPPAAWARCAASAACGEVAGLPSACSRCCCTGYPAEPALLAPAGRREEAAAAAAAAAACATRMSYTAGGAAGRAQSSTTASLASSFPAAASTSCPSSEQQAVPPAPPLLPQPAEASLGAQDQRKPSTLLSSSCFLHSWPSPGRLCTCRASLESMLATPGPCTDMNGEAKQRGASNAAFRCVLRSPSRMLSEGGGSRGGSGTWLVAASKMSQQTGRQVAAGAPC
jgi:hypothetical protein